MGFIEPLTIKDAVNHVHKKNFLLPAIQREFVWDTEQITKLFDSLMRDYPISSFLFWQVEKEKINNYQFYEFLRCYHEKNQRHNPKADISGEEDITAILDGQQRLTALYIGLKGSYSYKLPRKRWDNSNAFPERKLYLNLLSPSEDPDSEFDFRFLTSSEASRNDNNYFWFPVGEILNMKEAMEVSDYILSNLDFSSDSNNNKRRGANFRLFKLFDVIHKNRTINSFLEKDESLDKVLNIFIRVNSGGTQLSYSDLLLSIATAQWKDKDAREEITTFVDEINSLGDGFAANKDFILKSCLVISDFKDIAFKVDNFNQDNMLAIENNWENIIKAIRLSFVLLSGFGYSRQTLTSYNAIIPIAKYLYNIDSPSSFVESSHYRTDRNNIFKWLITALLKRTFSGQPDNVLRPVREVINNEQNEFPISQIFNRLKGSPKSMVFDNDEIHNLLYYQYGQAYTFSALAVLYPTLDFRNKFHQDHIFPKHLFTRSKLRKRGLSDEKVQFYMDNYNSLSNLQLLEGIPNQEKSGKDFKEWLETNYNDDLKKEYMKKHYIPDIDLSFENFEKFIDLRSKILIEEFKKLLRI